MQRFEKGQEQESAMPKVEVTEKRISEMAQEAMGMIGEHCHVGIADPMELGMAFVTNLRGAKLRGEQYPYSIAAFETLVDKANPISIPSEMVRMAGEVFAQVGHQWELEGGPVGTDDMLFDAGDVQVIGHMLEWIADLSKGISDVGKYYGSVYVQKVRADMGESLKRVSDKLAAPVYFLYEAGKNLERYASSVEQWPKVNSETMQSINQMEQQFFEKIPGYHFRPRTEDEYRRDQAAFVRSIGKIFQTPAQCMTGIAKAKESARKFIDEALLGLPSAKSPVDLSSPVVLSMPKTLFSFTGKPASVAMGFPVVSFPAPAASSASCSPVEQGKSAHAAEKTVSAHVPPAAAPLAVPVGSPAQSKPTLPLPPVGSSEWEKLAKSIRAKEPQFVQPQSPFGLGTEGGVSGFIARGKETTAVLGFSSHGGFGGSFSTTNMKQAGGAFAIAGAVVALSSHFQGKKYETSARGFIEAVLNGKEKNAEEILDKLSREAIDRQDLDKMRYVLSCLNPPPFPSLSMRKDYLEIRLAQIDRQVEKMKSTETGNVAWTLNQLAASIPGRMDDDERRIKLRDEKTEIIRQLKGLTDSNSIVRERCLNQYYENTLRKRESEIAHKLHQLQCHAWWPDEDEIHSLESELRGVRHRIEQVRQEGAAIHQRMLDAKPHAETSSSPAAAVPISAPSSVAASVPSSAPIPPASVSASHPSASPASLGVSLSSSETASTTSSVGMRLRHTEEISQSKPLFRSIFLVPTPPRSSLGSGLFSGVSLFAADKAVRLASAPSDTVQSVEGVGRRTDLGKTG
ncbi:MAG: hypothetical protein A2103_04450 [Gammaproteobacteria bacterium GWF2_41_13]|nr:MAG: hypothetical protein A2103_04450 [Gammaproteobacteria bacterium GWF2_41_13]